MAQHGEGAVVHQGAERYPVPAFELGERRIQVSRFEMSVLEHLAESGEMLERAVHAGFAQPAAVVAGDLRDDGGTAENATPREPGGGGVGGGGILLKSTTRAQVRLMPAPGRAPHRATA